MELKSLNKDEIKSLIQRRRLQILVHSCIYYVFGSSLISDNQWKDWAVELVSLQKGNPKIANQVKYAKEFKDFDPSTGYNLPIQDEDVISRALHLIRWHDRKMVENNGCN